MEPEYLVGLAMLVMSMGLLAIIAFILRFMP
jgi:Tfp pilus assembly protein PilV